MLSKLNLSATAIAILEFRDLGALRELSPSLGIEVAGRKLSEVPLPSTESRAYHAWPGKPSLEQL